MKLNKGLLITTLSILSMIALIVVMIVKGTKPDGAPYWMEKWQVTNIVTLLIGGTVFVSSVWKNLFKEEK